MTQKAFIAELNRKGYSYEIEGDRIVVTNKGYVSLGTLKSLPPGVEFRNKGNVYLNDLTSISPGVEFRNEGGVDLRALTSLSSGVEFRNEGYVDLIALTSISAGVEFRNKGYVDLQSLIGGWFGDWKGNLEGIDPKRLLNVMIKQGIFL